MIFWLASYPRSGSTLARTLLFKTMGLESVSDEAGENEFFGLKETDREKIGIAEIDGSWEDYYQRATESDKVFIVKTHRPPRDNQPAIYIVRDGRKAILSYSFFHQRFSSVPFPSLLELVLGGDFYGDWSEHFKEWVVRPNTLLLRYEDLIDPSRDLLAKIAEFVRFNDDVASWRNPFSQLHCESPEFFRKGEVGWQGDSAWSSMVNAVFFYIHGSLMVELGYVSQSEVERSLRDVPVEFFELVEASRRFLAGRKALQKICEERQVVISGLKLACDERLALIEKLSKAGR